MGKSKLALTEMLEALFGVKTVERINPLVTQCQNTVTRLLPINENRVSLVIFNLSVNSLYILPANDVSSTKGMYIAPSGGSISLIWDRDFNLVAKDWYGIAGAANSAILCVSNVIL